MNELCPEEIWKKRFNHINNFEQLLHDEGTIIIKLYLHIDKETQKAASKTPRCSIKKLEVRPLRFNRKKPVEAIRRSL